MINSIDGITRREFLTLAGGGLATHPNSYALQKPAIDSQDAQGGESCEALVQKHMPKYNILNRVAEIRTPFGYRGAIKPYAIRIFNTKSGHGFWQDLKGIHAENFLKNGQYDVVEIHELFGYPPTPSIAAVLYRAKEKTGEETREKTYVQFAIGEVKFYGKEGSVFCMNGWRPEITLEAIEAISRKRPKLEQNPAQPAPFQRRPSDKTI